MYSGYTIWRGVTPFKPFLSGANTVRIGWMPVGKLMVMKRLPEVYATAWDAPVFANIDRQMELALKTNPGVGTVTTCLRQSYIGRGARIGMASTTLTSVPEARATTAAA